MARQRSDERRRALLDAGAQVIATQGLGAATATIAREAGGSNGSLFLYFPTKSALLNELYVDLKTEMGTAAIAGLGGDGTTEERFRRVWTAWVAWASSHPEKRRALALLQVSDEILAESHTRGSEVMAPLAALLEDARRAGPLADAPPAFALGLADAIAEATMDEVIRHPDVAEERTALAFGAVWRALAG